MRWPSRQQVAELYPLAMILNTWCFILLVIATLRDPHVVTVGLACVAGAFTIVGVVFVQGAR